MIAEPAAPWCAGADWPAPADPASAARLLERFAEQGEAAATVAATESGRKMLAAAGGNAPYLADLAVREWAGLVRIARDGPEREVAAAMAALGQVRPEAPRAVVAAAMRSAKRRVALAVAMADIGNAWNLDQVTAALSDLAEAALRLAVGHALRGAHDSGAWPLPDPDDPGRGSGWIVLGMGKLGARELNYSSDVDLVLLHDSQGADQESRRRQSDSATLVFTRLTRVVVALMEAHDGDGYVFRTDLRLRPDPAATPPSVALLAALTYYEGSAQNWERAALLKARPVAGDLDAGYAFLQAVRPFVWRRGLDFTAVAEVQAIKRRIDVHKGTAAATNGTAMSRVTGFDVKLGRGGIREIEFLAQTLQLVWGGRDARLRTPRTIDALRCLARAGLLGVFAAGELVVAYRCLRRVEHRVQMVADRQTHRLPETAAGVGALATFLGFADADAFARVLLRHTARVRSRYAEVFVDVPAGGEQALGDACGLDALGFADPASIRAVIDGWEAGRVRAFRSERARALLHSVLPGLLRAVARQPEPDAAFVRLDRFIAALPAGVQLLSLFQRNPQLVDRVSDVLGAAPSLSEHLVRNPAALEGLLAPSVPGDFGRLLTARLGDARGLEDVIAITRRTVREEDFSISVATLEGRIDADAGGELRSALAVAAIRALLPAVLADMARRHGTVPGGELAVALLGKGGSREMMAGSDLDLLLVYDHPPDVADSAVAGTGRSIPAGQWFVRAVHALVAALTAPDAGGGMYAIDMRLRPSGNKGPVAVSLAAFEAYHAEGGSAWTWERMALTRARVVAGPARLAARLGRSIDAAIACAGAPATVLADAASMRLRVLHELKPPRPPYALHDGRQRPGGLVEVEFVAQALQLVNAHRIPPIRRTTREALVLLREGGALEAVDCAVLIEADRAWRTVLGMLRLVHTRGTALPPAGAAAQALVLAARGAGVAAVDVGDLRARLDRMSASVRAVFVRLVGPLDEEKDR